MSRMTINQLLTHTRASADPLTPEEAHAATKNGAVLIDTRCAATDVIGGFRAWRDSGLPVTHPQPSS